MDLTGKHVPYKLQTPDNETGFKLDPGGILNQLSAMVDTGAADATFFVMGNHVLCGGAVFNMIWLVYGP